MCAYGTVYGAEIHDIQRATLPTKKIYRELRYRPRRYLSRWVSNIKLVCWMKRSKSAVVEEHPTNADRWVNRKRKASINQATRGTLLAMLELQPSRKVHFRRMGMCVPVGEVSSLLGPLQHRAPELPALHCTYVEYSTLWSIFNVSGISGLHPTSVFK